MLLRNTVLSSRSQTDAIKFFRDGAKISKPSRVVLDRSLCPYLIRSYTGSALYLSMQYGKHSKALTAMGDIVT